MTYFTLFWMAIGMFFFFGGIYVRKHPYSQIKHAYSYRLKKIATPQTVEIYAKKTANTYQAAGATIVALCLVAYSLQSAALLLIGSFIAFFYVSFSLTYWKKLILQKVPYGQLTIISLFFLLFFLFLGIASHESSVEIEHEKITLSGLYGESLRTDQLSQVFLADTLPHLGMRMNGVSLGKIQKGYFYSNSLDQNVKIMLHSDSPPYLYLITPTHYLILNFKDKNKTLGIYKRLKEMTDPHPLQKK